MGGAEAVVGQRKRVWWHRTWRSRPGGLDGPSDRERQRAQRPQSSGGCYVFVALQKKTLAMSKGHEWLRAVTATAVATEGDMGFDHRRSTSRHVGEMLSLDSEERRVGGVKAGVARGKRCSGWSRSCRWTAKASMVTPDLEIRTRRSRQT
ncbi:hypothetical protein BHE74_00015005 [Ensete ventricosum]|nr:hypothetical protein BHE74_00015005 [Ensete ventricosum]